MNETTVVEQLPSAGFFITLIFFACLCIIVGVMGNVGVIIYNTCMNHSKTPTTYFLINLAISDLVVCLTFFPFWIFVFISTLTEKTNNHTLICKLHMTSSYAIMAVSVANLLAMTMDKCLFITKPLKYPRIMTWKRTYIILAVLWILLLVDANIIFFNIEEVEGTMFYCTIKNKLIRRVLPILNFFLPLVVILFLNFKIYNVAKIQRRKIENCATRISDCTVHKYTSERQKMKQLKMIKTFAIILGVMLLCLCPRMVISVQRIYGYTMFNIPLSVSMLFRMLWGANAAMNPLIYSARNKEYRIAYRKLILVLTKK